MSKTAGVLAGILLLAGCGAEPTGIGAGTGLEGRAAAARATGNGDNRDLATLRAATARFHRFETAQPAGYTFLFMDMCMEDPALGGMGYHYVNPDSLDARVSVEAPEAILYEPGPNGQLRLIAVEYVIPADAWTSPNPPTLFGRTFVLNSFGLWALHVWVWKDNPSGLYADWNPRVSCANAAGASTAVHH